MGKISNILTAPQKTNGLDWEFGVGRGGLGLPGSLTTHHLLGRSSSHKGIWAQTSSGEGLLQQRRVSQPTAGFG